MRKSVSYQNEECRKGTVVSPSRQSTRRSFERTSERETARMTESGQRLLKSEEYGRILKGE